jgi:hypothetical protein
MLWSYLMTRKGFPSKAMAIPRITVQLPSKAAQSLARWATVSYRISLFLAVLSLLVAATFAMLTPEPLWMRIASFGFLGLLPAFVGYSIGLLVFWILSGASAIYDSVASLFRRICRLVTVAGRVCIMSATFPVRVIARLLIRLLPRRFSTAPT